MARVTVEDCMKKINNRFLLVHLAARRVIQLRKGAGALVHAPKNKDIVLALREIAAGKVSFESLPQFEQERLTNESELGALQPSEPAPLLQEASATPVLPEPEDENAAALDSPEEGDTDSEDTND